MSGNNPYGQDSQHHVLSVLVKNRPGVLARVSALFARRGYNIFSLAVAPTDHHEYSRITIVVDLDSAPLEQIVKQLFKLIDVVRIIELDPKLAVKRELVVVTVKAEAEERGQIAELVRIFDGKILSVGSDKLTVSVDDEPDKVDDFVNLLSKYGIVETQRSGMVALPRLSTRPTN